MTPYIRRLGTATRRPFTTRPGNAALPLALWIRPEAAEAPPTDPLGRDPKTARVEAALLLADEQLTPRRIADVAGLADAAEARAAIARLRELLDADGAAFQVE